MISPSAVQSFLNRKLDDHSWMKRLSEAKVDAAINQLVPRPNLGEFRISQKVGFLLGLTYPQFYFIYDMGAGKTRLALRLLEYQYRIGLLHNWSVILVPTEEAALAWEEEIIKTKVKLPYRLLFGSTEEKWQALEGIEYGLVIISYLGYATMVSQLQKKKKGKGNERVHNPASSKQMAAYTDALVMDEITFLANHQSLFYDAVKPLSFAAKVRYGLAGRPVGRDPAIAWPQFFLVDHGASLGNTLGLFRDAYFTKKKRYWGGPYSFDYKVNKDLEPDLARALAHRSLSYDITECEDMPELVPIVSRSRFASENSLYYQRVTSELIKAKGDWRLVDHAFIRMRQITSGFVGFVDDETGEKAEVEFKHNPKLDDLMDKVLALPAGRKCLIWHEYNWTGGRICRELEKHKINYGRLWGGTENWGELKDRFDNDPKLTAMVVNHKKGAFSLNMQAANYDFIFESPVAPIPRAQMERRTWRGGQKRTVFRYDFVIDKSVDVRILAFLKEGRDIHKALVANPRKTLAL